MHFKATGILLSRNLNSRNAVLLLIACILGLSFGWRITSLPIGPPELKTRTMELMVVATPVNSFGDALLEGLAREVLLFLLLPCA